MKYTKHLSMIGVGALGVLMTVGLLAGCERQEQESLAGGDQAGSGNHATFTIGLQDTPAYNAPDGETRGTDNREPLVAEWVAVNSFDATRPVEESGEAAGEYTAEGGNKNEGPRIALMELREDTVSVRPATRSVMPEGYTFRIIAFWKSPAGGYEFESVADYVSNGTATPELRRGGMYLSVGQTYRFVAYSFNNTADMGNLLSDYTWNGTSVTIPDLDNDFMTYDSDDKTVSDENFTLPVSFKQQLCKLTVKISGTGFVSNTVTGCTGAYIEQGGASSSWTVGANGITPDTNNTTFNITDNSTTAIVRLVPFTSARPLTVHFEILCVGGKTAFDANITSSQSVRLKAGKSYTMNVQFKWNPGIQIPAEFINLSNPDTPCTDQDRADLAMLAWAEGNLKSTDNSKPYIWAPNQYDYGYYYTWMSTYTGNTTQTGIDPCTKLNPAIYGGGWRTPSKNELTKLSRCTNKQLLSNNGVMGMWFMNIPNGLFLPAAGYRGNDVGSGTTPTGYAGTLGYFWSSDAYDSSNGYSLSFGSGYAGINLNFRTHGFSVRCVKGAIQ